MKSIVKGSPHVGLIYAIAMVSTMMICSSATAEESQQAAEEKIREAVTKVINNSEVSSISPSVINGLYEVMLGPQLIYVSADGKYLLSGKLYDIDEKKDLSSPKIAQAKAKYLESVSEDDMVIFGPKDYKHTITVFTDIDCGYCRKLHAEIDDYNDLGIRVRYMMFPRAGVGSESYEKAVSVFCADDRNEAMTRSKAGKDIPEKTCDNPVTDHYELGQLLGVSGTPAIFLDTGDMLPGYIPAKRMSKMLIDLDKDLASRKKTTVQ
jgi:thiol:disulfide interchange protein DsbC